MKKKNLTQRLKLEKIEIARITRLGNLNSIKGGNGNESDDRGCGTSEGWTTANGNNDD